MIIFPLKWLPWILAIGGFIALVTTGEPSSIFSMLIGVVWLVFKYKGQNGRTGKVNTSQTSLNNNSVYNAPAQSTRNAPDITSSENIILCPNCNTQVGNGMSFCTKCGTKVR